MVRSESDSGAAARDVVAIDGPSGAGKSTVARALAQRLGFAYLDTGAMYRAVTWHFLENGIPAVRPLDDETKARAVRLLEELDLAIEPEGAVVVHGRDVTSHLRSREVESRVSAVSAMPEVRERMRMLQRGLAARGPLVTEGRDMGSVVFPRARWKVYLDAAREERARRRLEDFRRRGRDVTLHQVIEEMAVRDRLDSTRVDAPLIRTPGAVYVDTTGLSIEQVVARLQELVRGHPEGLSEEVVS